MSTAITSTEIARTAEAAAPGRVSYNLVRSRTITIASTDGESELCVGLTDDPVHGGDCVLAAKRTRVEIEGQPTWDDGDSVVVDTLRT
ncbi:MAG: hypothetical protein IPK74_40035 [Deltaproteobacteria bacterium]|nr:hypothetical protein [Deltaproteobacteria bacterium]